MQKRSAALDFLRVFSCIGVIGIHAVSIIKPGDGETAEVILRYIITNHIVRLGFPVFFVLSSKSLLGKRDLLSDVSEYYKGKLIHLGIPFLLWSIFYYEISNKTYTSFITVVKAIPEALRSMLTKTSYYHLGYMYTLIGLVLLVPFLKRLLDHLSYKEYGLLCLIIMCTQILSTYKLMLLGELIFGTWVIYYILGAFVLKEESEKIYPYLIGCGLFSFIISVYVNYYDQESILMRNIFEYSPLIIFQIMGVVAGALWLEKKVAFPDRTIAFLSGLTFEIYLAHPIVLNTVNKYIQQIDIIKRHRFIFFVISVLLTFIISSMIALIIECVLKPISKKIKEYV